MAEVNGISLPPFASSGVSDGFLVPCTQREQNGTRRYARRMCYPIAQCVDGEGFARRVAGKRGKVMGCKPSCGGKGQAFTPEQRPQRARGQRRRCPSREAVSLATRGKEWARRARHPPGQTRWYRGFQPSLGKVNARGRFFVTEPGRVSAAPSGTSRAGKRTCERRKGRHESD